MLSPISHQVDPSASAVIRSTTIGAPSPEKNSQSVVIDRVQNGYSIIDDSRDGDSGEKDCNTKEEDEIDG